MTTHQKTLLNKGMYISLGLVIGIVIFAFTFGGAWAGLEGQVDANTEDITNINGKLDKIGDKLDSMADRQAETNGNIIELKTLLERR